MYILRKMLFLITLLALSSCYARQGFPIDSKGVGVSKVFENTSYNRVWNASIKAVKSSYFVNKDLNFISGDKRSGLIKLEKKGSTLELLVTGIYTGERVVVFVDRVKGRNAVRVEAVSQKITTDNPLSSKDWEPSIIRKIQYLLERGR